MKHVLPLLLALSLLLTACQLPDKSSQLPRPYGVGYNFHVHADSLLLQEDRPMHWCQGVAETSDSLFVFHENHIVIAAITIIPEDCVDSVWVKVARDQFTMGWTHENDLLAATCPDDPISHCIQVLSALPTITILCLTAVALALFIIYLTRWRRPAITLPWDIPTFNPTILLITLGASVIIYRAILHLTPDDWSTFFFNPTLNPFSQPFLVCGFLISLWAILLLSFICADDIFKLLHTKQALLYLLTWIECCVLIILLGTWLPLPLFVVLWIAYSAAAIHRYWHRARPHFFCGKCGIPLQHKGPCPNCGAINE